MLPANMLGTVTSSCVACLMRSPLQPQQRQRRLPAGLARLPVRHLDGGGAVGVAVDEPLEAEIDERRRLDEELSGGDRKVPLQPGPRAQVRSDANDEQNDGE